MFIEDLLRQHTAAAVEQLYGACIEPSTVSVSEPPKQFTGDFSIVVFPYSKISRKAPPVVGNEIAQYLQQQIPQIANCQVVQGFINVTFTANFWLDVFKNISQTPNYGQQSAKNETIVLEYCGPNTNKALHLGHIRNMLLGYATVQILRFNGYQVHPVCIYNDRGIAICKSMLAWQLFGNNETPTSAHLKGDRLVDKYYVLFGDALKPQTQAVMEANPQITNKQEAEKLTPLMQQAEEMLLKWEANDPEIRQLWATMNGWVYEGFEATYQKLGIEFEKNYYESETYLSGKALIEDGLKQGIFVREPDKSVQIDLSDIGLDKKILLRSDGTSVYMTQDLGTAMLRYQDFKMDRMIYVVANEQEYHFKVLFECVRRLGGSFADGLFHLSYGMVELPDGKMKSREGTTVIADDLIAQMIEEAAEQTRALSKTDSFTGTEARQLFETLGLGALKFFILRVNPKKAIIFNPKESIDLHGFTAPFIQYTYARIRSMFRKHGTEDIEAYTPPTDLAPEERELLSVIYHYPKAVVEAGNNYDASVIANYAYQVAKTFNKFYNECPVLNAADANARLFRLHLSQTAAYIIQSAMQLLGIAMPERM